MRISRLAFIFVLVLLIPAAKADSVTYTFVGTNSNLYGDNGLSVAFVYVAPGFCPDGPEIGVLASQLESCTNCENSGIPTVYFSEQPLFGDQLQFNDKL